MKIKNIIFTIIVLLGAIAAAWAATMTIEIPSGDVPRVCAAYGSILNLGRDATPLEVNAAIVGWLRQSTEDYERRKNMAVYSPPPLQMTPVPLPPSPTPGGLKVEPQPTPKKK